MKMILPYWRNPGFSIGSEPAAFLRCDFSATQMAGTLTDYSPWSAATNYAAGQKVSYANDIWEKVTSAAAGTMPNAITADWKKIGTTNIRAPFDLSNQVKGWVYSGFSSATPRGVSINPYYSMSGYYLSVAVVDAILIVGMVDVQSVTISYKRYSNDAPRTEIATVWTETITVSAGCVFKKFGSSIPKPAANEYSGVEVMFAPPGVNTVMQVGDIILGRVFNIGETRPGYSVTIDDYSKKTVDQYGAVSVVERPYSKSMVIDSLVDADADADNILNSIVNYRAKMNGFVGVDGRPSTYTIGMPSGISLKYEGPRANIISMKIDGVI